MEKERGYAPAGPAIALLSSAATDAFVLGRGFASVSQLLAPFTQQTISLRVSTTLLSGNSLAFSEKDIELARFDSACG